MSHAAEPNPRAALAALLALEEAERQRIAHELHSEIGQDLTAALLGLQFFAEGGVPAEEVPELSGSVRRALERVRALSLRLRPPLLDEIGLGPALRSSLEQIAGQRGLQLDLHLPDSGTRPSVAASTLVFRTLQALALQLPADTGVALRLELQPLLIELVLENGPALEAAASLLDERLTHLQPRFERGQDRLRVLLHD